MSQELWASALAELGAACIQRVEMNMNTVEEIQSTFEWCLVEMEQLLLNQDMNYKKDTNAKTKNQIKNDKKSKLKKIMKEAVKYKKFY